MLAFLFLVGQQQRQEFNINNVPGANISTEQKTKSKVIRNYLQQRSLKASVNLTKQYFRMPAVSVRQFALLLMLLLTAVLARQQPETRQDRRSTHVRGVSSSRLARQLEIGHGDKSEDGKGKGGSSSSSRGKGGKSEKVPKGGGSGKGHYNDDDEEATEPHYDSEDLPSTDDEDDSTSGDEEDSKGKSPKGGPGTDKGDDEGKGKDKDEGKGKGKGKGNEHFQHGK